MTSPEPTELPTPVDVSVIICTRDRAAMLDGAVESALASLDAIGAGRTAELLLVDNASTDATPDVIAAWAQRDARVRYVLAPEPGLGRARNVGVRAARGLALLFTDDDIVVPPSWVESMAEPLLADEADIVFGGVAMAPELERPWMTAKLRGLYYAHNPAPREVDPEPVGASMGARREVVESVPFDGALGVQPYPGAEDVLFRSLSKRAGYRIRGVRGATVAHHFDSSRLDAPRLRSLAEGYGRCDAFLFHHHWLEARVEQQTLRLIASWLRARWIEATRPEPHDERLVDAIRKLSFHRELRALRNVPRGRATVPPRASTAPSRRTAGVRGGSSA